MNRVRPYLRGLVLIVLLMGLGYLVKVTGLYGLLDETWIDEQIRDKGLTGDFLFLAAGMMMTALGFPRQAVSFLGGYGFGFGEGTVLALGATVLGCALAFYFARLVGRATVLRLFSERIRRLDKFLHDHPFSTALLIRLLPVGSNLVTNLAAGVSGVRALPFIAGSGLGFIPQTVIFALLGSGIHLDPVLRISTGVVLFLISGMLGVALFRRYRKSLALDQDMAGVIPAGPESGPVPGRGPS
jgi:uncharacterized membrane protein YdjX (TVP38/TMEM64 family)